MFCTQFLFNLLLRSCRNHPSASVHCATSSCSQKLGWRSGATGLRRAAGRVPQRRGGGTPYGRAGEGLRASFQGTAGGLNEAHLFPDTPEGTDS